MQCKWFTSNSLHGEETVICWAYQKQRLILLVANLPDLKEA